MTYVLLLTNVFCLLSGFVLSFPIVILVVLNVSNEGGSGVIIGGTGPVEEIDYRIYIVDITYSADMHLFPCDIYTSTFFHNA